MTSVLGVPFVLAACSAPAAGGPGHDHAGYERINMSLFKDFSAYREQRVQFHADVFNLFNTPAYVLPSQVTNGSNGGQITSSRFFQNFTPDARFFQLFLKYVFDIFSSVSRRAEIFADRITT